MTERIRQLNEQMAREPPIPPDQLTQASTVKFKDKLVDFVSPTPEPQWDSEEDRGSSQNTPRTDRAEGSGGPSRCSDPDAASEAVGTSSKSDRPPTAAESDQQDQSLTVADGLQNPRSSSLSVSESEVERNKSDRELNAPEDTKLASRDEKSLRTTAQPAAEASLRHPDDRLSAIDAAETNRTDPETSGSSDNQSSDRHRALQSTMMAAKVVGSWGKPTAVKNGELPSKTDCESTNRPPGSPGDDRTEKQVSDRKIRAVQTPLLAAKVLQSPRPRSADLKLVGGSRDGADGSKKTPGESQVDDLALVECSGKFRMMSVAELTAMQRHNLSSGVATCTPRPPSTSWNHSPR